MSSWTTADALNSLDLSDVATFARVENEAPSSFVDPGVLIPGRDGVSFDAEAPRSPLVATLRVHLRWTDPDGDITHADGEVGHIRENLSLIKKELGKPAPIWSRTLEHIGNVRAVVKLAAPGFVGEQRHVYLFPLTIASGSWQDAAESSSAGNPVTDGDTTIFDPRMSISGAATVTVTLGDGTVYTITAASGPSYPVVIDVGAGTVTDNASADALDAVSFSHEHWFRLLADDTATVSGGTRTVFWRNRWA